jgi:tetratricopeptide (TPR) repeat protein
LNDVDIQGIYDLLPIDQRKSKLSRETNATYGKDSIFEFISRNVRHSSISQRYENVLKELELKNVLLAEFLVLASYVHYSRTPLSFDMLYSYFDDEIGDYQDIFQMRDDLKDLIKDYSGDLIMEEDQDYYYPRSIYTAETILKVANKELLKTVIRKTLYRIPSIQIPFYNIFRKSAFDKNLILRAFSNWKEGKEFYEDAYEYDFKNPYVLQQGALYLAHMKKFNEAFNWIDKAITQTNNKYFSIRNSHAIILFDANINSKEETEEIRNQLDYSMSILEKCITNDNRKIFHAIRYAEQVIEYSKRYFDNKTRQYLENAKSWLRVEQRKSNWNTEIRLLLKQLDEIS